MEKSEALKEYEFETKTAIAEEIQEFLEEGKELERRLQQIKKRLKYLAKLTEITIDLDKWEVKPNEY